MNIIELEKEIERVMVVIDEGVSDATSDFPDVGADDIFHDIAMSILSMESDSGTSQLVLRELCRRQGLLYQGWLPQSWQEVADELR